ncbi:MgtC/SapB family protein [Phreatobacter sp. HK31-P]|nr:MgtC/SapB family protein [Phreatobacter sp.]
MLDLLMATLRADLLPHLTALTIAYVLVLPIGWDREKEDRSAGLRTFPLVAIACCGFVQAAEAKYGAHPDAMGKIVEGLITGIGFIGGGAILKQGASVKGTATAASLWATGAIGTAVGLGAYGVAAMIAVFTVVTLKWLTPLKPEVRNDGEAALPDRNDATTVQR